jgi:nucleoside-diphosphate-sugar epimerase
LEFFLTGGTGLLGTYFLIKALEQGHGVTAIYRNEKSIELSKKIFALQGTQIVEKFSKINWVQANLLNPLELDELILPHHTVVHCAGMVSFLPSDEQEMYKSNFVGTQNLVNVCIEKGVKKFIHISSVSTLCKEEEIRDETSFQRPAKEAGFYGKSKYLAEMEVWRGMQEGLNACVLSPSIILGAHDWNKGSSKMFGVAHQGLLFYTLGKTGFVDVNDVAEAILVVAKTETKQKRYCLNAENIFYKDFFENLHLAFGKPMPKYKAGKFLTSLYWRLQWLKSKITNSAPLVTKESASTAHSIRLFNGDRFAEEFSFSYTPINKSVASIVKKYNALKFN